MKKSKQTPVIIDVDTGIDDAVALGMAFSCKKFNILLITTSAGNVGVEQSTKNTLDILYYFKHSNIPVAKGVAEPLVRKRNEVSVHGEDGIGNYSNKFPKHNLKELDCVAHEAMTKAILSSENKVTIIALGPLTNIAKLLLLHPEVKTKIDKIVIMAGSIEKYDSNELPYAGFNVRVDPEACEVVLNSGVEVVVSPMDMGHIAYLDYYEIYKTKFTNMAGKFFELIFRSYKDHHVKNGIAMHDSCAVAYCIDKNMFKTEKLYVHVQYYDELKTGVLRCEWKDPRNFEVCTECNLKKFKKLYFKMLKRIKTIDD